MWHIVERLHQEAWELWWQREGWTMGALRPVAEAPADGLSTWVLSHAGRCETRQTQDAGAPVQHRMSCEEVPR